MSNLSQMELDVTQGNDYYTYNHTNQSNAPALNPSSLVDLDQENYPARNL